MLFEPLPIRCCWRQSLLTHEWRFRTSPRSWTGSRCLTSKIYWCRWFWMGRLMGKLTRCGRGRQRAVLCMTGWRPRKHKSKTSRFNERWSVNHFGNSFWVLWDFEWVYQASRLTLWSTDRLQRTTTGIYCVWGALRALHSKSSNDESSTLGGIFATPRSFPYIRSWIFLFVGAACV